MRRLKDLTLADYRLAIGRAIVAFRDDDVPGMAAGVAFKVFLALFPTLVSAVAIYGLVLTRQEIQDRILDLATALPAEAQGFVRDNLDRLVEVGTRGAGSVLVLSVLVGLFSASGAAATLIKAMNRAYSITDRRSFVKQRLVGLLLTGALLLALTSLVVLIVAGPAIQSWLLPPQLQMPAVEVPLAVGRYLLVLVVLSGLFAFTYSAGPNRETPTWEWLSPGAVLGVLGWVALGAGFRWYTATIGTFQDSPIYGTLGGVIVLLLWLQLSMLALLVGAELNAELERIKAERAASRAAVLDGADPPPDAG